VTKDLDRAAGQALLVIGPSKRVGVVWLLGVQLVDPLSELDGLVQVAAGFRDQVRGVVERSRIVRAELKTAAVEFQGLRWLSGEEQNAGQWRDGGRLVRGQIAGLLKVNDCVREVA